MGTFVHSAKVDYRLPIVSNKLQIATTYIVSITDYGKQIEVCRLLLAPILKPDRQAGKQTERQTERQRQKDPGSQTDMLTGMTG
jgi:hypothetical protein